MMSITLSCYISKVNNYLINTQLVVIITRERIYNLFMKQHKKPKWLKYSYWKRKITNFILELLFFRKKDLAFCIKNSDKSVLVTSMDGLGDTFLRLPILKIMQKKYKKVWVLSKSISLPIYNTCGFSVIEYNDNMSTNIFKRYRLIKKLNALPIEKVYAGEFYRNNNLVKYLKGQRIGFANPRNSKQDGDLDVILPSANHTDDLLLNFAQAITNDFVDVTDNRLHLPRHIQTMDKNEVVWALGAQDKIRMMRVSNLVQLIECILNIDSDCSLVLVGAGKKEQQYASKIMDMLKNNLDNKFLERIIVKIDCYSLLELVQLIYQSKILIGFDSGLYNLSYTLHQPTLCLAAENERVLHRKASWVRIVKNENGCEYGVDDGYGCTITNSVSLDDFSQAYQELCLMLHS